MVSSTIPVRDLEELRAYVNRTFCDEYELKPGAFQMTERRLRRQNRPCGLFFCLHGPRAVKFTAIYETETHQVLFYDPSGERFLRCQLVDCEELQLA